MQTLENLKTAFRVLHASKDLMVLPTQNLFSAVRKYHQATQYFQPSFAEKLLFLTPDKDLTMVALRAREEIRRHYNAAIREERDEVYDAMVIFARAGITTLHRANVLSGDDMRLAHKRLAEAVPEFLRTLADSEKFAEQIMDLTIEKEIARRNGTLAEVH